METGAALDLQEALTMELSVDGMMPPGPQVPGAEFQALSCLPCNPGVSGLLFLPPLACCRNGSQGLHVSYGGCLGSEPPRQLFALFVPKADGALDIQSTHVPHLAEAGQ